MTKVARNLRLAKQPAEYYKRLRNLLGINAIQQHIQGDDPAGSTAADISIFGRNGAISAGVMLANKTGATSHLVPKFPNAGFVNVNSASLRSAVNMREGALIIWGQVENEAVWTDGLTHFLGTLYADTNNRVVIAKVDPNKLRFRYDAAGANFVDASFSSLDPFCTILSWSDSGDYAKIYINGILVQTITPVGTFTGALSSTIGAIMGATDVTPTNPFFGWVYDWAVVNRPLTDSEAKQIYAIASNKPTTVTLPQNLMSTPHTLREDFESSGDWTSSGSPTLADDATRVKTGTRSLKITTASGVAATITKTVNLSLSSDFDLRLSCYIEDRTKISQIQVQLANDSGFTKYYSATASVTALENRWNTLHLTRADFAGTGSPSWSTAMVRLRLIVTPASGQVAVVNLACLDSGMYSRPAVVMTFDDGWESVYRLAYPYMQSRGMKGTAYVVTDFIGKPGYMTAAQLQELNRAGWSIANHSRDHRYWISDGLSQTQMEAEIIEAKTVLDGLGLTRASGHLAYPGGEFNDTALVACTNAGVLTARSTESRHNEFIPPAGIDYLRSQPLLNTVTLVSMKNLLQTAVQRGEMMIHHLHKIVNGTASDSLEWSYSDFCAWCDWIASKDLPALTITDLYGLLSAPVTIARCK